MTFLRVCESSRSSAITCPFGLKIIPTCYHESDSIAYLTPRYFVRHKGTPSETILLVILQATWHKGKQIFDERIVHRAHPTCAHHFWLASCLTLETLSECLLLSTIPIRNENSKINALCDASINAFQSRFRSRVGVGRDGKVYSRCPWCKYKDTVTVLKLLHTFLEQILIK